jgi:hypothetical protein
MLVSNSLLKAHAMCEKQFEYKAVDQLVPNRVGLPLKRGSWLHELLQVKYEGGDWRRRHRELTKEFNRMFDEEKEYYGDLPGACEDIMRRYDYTWRIEDSGLIVIAVEKVFEVSWPHGHTFQGKFDVIVEDEYGRWLMEHKSHKTIPDDAYRFQDVQTARYVWGLNRLGTYGEITGILWNYLSTTLPKRPQVTKTGRLSRRRIRTDVLTFTSALLEYGFDIREFKDDIIRLKGRNDFFRRERVPIQDKVVERLVREGVVSADRMERGPYVRNIGRHCSFQCSYQDLCIADLYGGNTNLLIKAKFHQEEPLAYHGTTEEAS